MFQPTEMTTADQATITYRVHAGDGVSLGDCLKPEAWAHQARRLAFGYKVEVIATDGSWFAELIVRSVGRTEAVMGLLRHVEFNESAHIPTETPNYEIKFRGPRKWSVIRLSDDAVVKEDIDTREQAETALRNHMKALAA